MTRLPRRDRDTRTTTEAGLGWAHTQAAAAVMAIARVCAICGRPPRPGQRLVRGHIIARTHGGQSVPSNYQPECRTCSSRGGAAITNARRKQAQANRRIPTSRIW